jgi:hypothetical protein
MAAQPSKKRKRLDIKETAAYFLEPTCIFDRYDPYNMIKARLLFELIYTVGLIPDLADLVLEFVDFKALVLPLDVVGHKNKPWETHECSECQEDKRPFLLLGGWKCTADMEKYRTSYPTDTETPNWLDGEKVEWDEIESCPDLKLCYECVGKFKKALDDYQGLLEAAKCMEKSTSA